MEKVTQEKKLLSQQLSTVSNRYALVFCVCIAIVLVVTDVLLGITLQYVHLLHLIIAIVGIVIVILYQAIKNIETRRGAIIIYTILHIIFHYALIFAIPLPSPYLLFILGPSLVVYYAFGTRAVITSGLTSGIILFSQFVVRGQFGMDTLGVTMVYYVIAMVVLAYVIIFLKIAEQERQALQKVTHQIDLERSRLSTLVNNLNDAVIACDSSFNILLSNPRAQELLNIDHSLKGKHLDSLLDLRDVDGGQTKISNLAGTDKHVSVFTSYRLFYSRNDFVNLYIGINQIRHGKEAPQGYVILLRDITKLKTMEEERNEFVYIMSHELRTPVSIVEGGISLAQQYNKKHSPAKVAEYLEKAHNQSLMLASIVRSLSTLVNTEKGGEKVEVSEIEPRQFIDHVKNAYQGEAHEKGLKLSAHCDSDLRTIYTNEEYLYEIIQNLMTNALKYTNEGSITISVKSHMKTHMAFTVTDTGLGISKSDQTHIFEKFWRSENYKTRKSGGTGLGLYLTKKLADKIGARIDVESTLGEGSKFTIYVPIYDTQEI